MEDPVIPLDFVRMFFGDDPPLFYVEILFRTLVIYGYTLGLIRWIGGRSVAQLSMVDMLLVIALGSAVGDATFYPEVPLLHAMLAITVIVLLNKVLDVVAARSKRANRIIDGRPIVLVRNGCINVPGRKASDLSMEEVKSMLRRKGVANLGQVEMAFVEEGGGMSVFARRDAGPGLSLLPPDDMLRHVELRIPGKAESATLCCTECGYLRSAGEDRLDPSCGNCGNRHWTEARRMDTGELPQLD